MLPYAPNYRQKYEYLKTDKWKLYPLSIFSFIVVITGSVLFCLSHSPLILFLPFFVLLTAYIGLGYYIGVFSKDFNEDAHTDIIHNHLAHALTKTVDVYLPTAGEDLNVLHNAYTYVSKIDWPRDRLRIYVLDDSRRVEVASLADRFEFNYFSREDAPKDKKAGNLRDAFARTDGEFILILDADFCPRSDILKEMMPHIVSDDGVGIVQTPQYFDSLSDRNPISKAASFIQILFYKLIQVNRDYYDAAICVGSCSLHRRKALEPLGGTYLINYSEDVHTGVSIYPQHRVKYLPVNLAMGVSPDTITAFFSQQMRWAAGSLALCTNRELFWDGRFNAHQIMCYMTGFLYYITTGISALLYGLPSLIMLLFYKEYIVWYTVLFTIPSLYVAFFLLPAWSRSPFSFWYLRLRLISWVAHLYAIKDRVTNKITPWVVTNNKSGHSMNNKKLVTVLWYLAITNFLVILLTLDYCLSMASGWVGFILLISPFVSSIVIYPSLAMSVRESWKISR